MSTITVAIEEDPFDPVRYEAYATWLEQQSDPRAQLIRLQLEYETLKNPTLRDRLLSRIVTYFNAHRQALLPDVLDDLDTERMFREPSYQVSWRFGFLHRVEFTDNGGKRAATLEAILKHPSGRFLTSLFVLCNWDAQQSVVDVVARNAPATLQALELRVSEQIDLSALWPALPRFRKFVLDMRSDYSTEHGWLVPKLTLGAVDLPVLRHLRISGHRRELTALFTVAFPSLQELDMNLTELAVRDLRALLARTDLPALRVLRMWETTSTNELCREVAVSFLGRQLTKVDVANGQLTDAGAESWAAAQNSRLEAVFVGGNPLSRRGREALERVATLVVDGDDAR